MFTNCMSSTAALVAAVPGSPVKNVEGEHENLKVRSLFSEAQWRGNLHKVVNITSGAIVGGKKIASEVNGLDTTTSLSALVIDPTEMNGTLEINIFGKVLGTFGKGQINVPDPTNPGYYKVGRDRGTAMKGGNAIDILAKRSDDDLNADVIIRFKEGSSTRGGGGGGGSGGQGDSVYVTPTQRVPATGYQYSDGQTYLYRSLEGYPIGEYGVVLNGMTLNMENFRVSDSEDYYGNLNPMPEPYTFTFDDNGQVIPIVVEKGPMRDDGPDFALAEYALILQSEEGPQIRYGGKGGDGGDGEGYGNNSPSSMNGKPGDPPVVDPAGPMIPGGGAGGNGGDMSDGGFGLPGTMGDGYNPTPGSPGGEPGSCVLYDDSKTKTMSFFFDASGTVAGAFETR